MSESKRVFAIVTRARGVFFKPLYESLVDAMPANWSAVLIRPHVEKLEHPDTLVTPQSPRLRVRDVSSRAFQLRGADEKLEKRAMPYDSFWPSDELRQTLEREAPSMILIHEFSPFTLYALYYAKRRGIPVLVSTELGRPNESYFKLHTRVLHRVWGMMVDGVLACCPAAHQPLSGRSLPHFSTYHAIDCVQYQPMKREPSEVTTFVYLGRYNRRKGLDLLLEAAAKLKASTQKPFKLKLIGYGDEAWLNSEIQRLKLEKESEVVGFLSGDAIVRALGESDVFVLPTRQDTYAAVVHEAACMGLPLLISRHAGAAEALVKQGVNGFVMTPEDTDQMAKFMHQLLDANLRGTMSVESRATGEAFCARKRGQGLWDWIKHHWFPHE